MNGPAGPNHVAERAQSPCPAPQFGPFTEALKGPTETRKEVRHWAIALAAVLQHTSPEAIQILLEDIEFAWHETLGVRPNADAAALRRAMARLALIYHPDKGGQPDLMSRVNAAYERAQRDWSR
jgi:DnaJ-domain-containing protein 1